MTPSGIEPATFRFVAQRLKHCATAVPNILLYSHEIDPPPPPPAMIDHVHNVPNQAPVLSHTNPVHCDLLERKKATANIFGARVRHSLTHSGSWLRFPVGRLSPNFLNK